MEIFRLPQQPRHRQRLRNCLRWARALRLVVFCEHVDALLRDVELDAVKQLLVQIGVTHVPKTAPLAAKPSRSRSRRRATRNPGAASIDRYARCTGNR